MKQLRKSPTGPKALRNAKQKKPSKMLDFTRMQDKLLHGGADDLTLEQAEVIKQLRSASFAARADNGTTEEALRILAERGFLTATGQLKKIYGGA